MADFSEIDNEDVPPLEDMSHILQEMAPGKEVKPIRIQESSHKVATKYVITKPAKNSNSVPEATQSQKPASFGGMKKGFLFSSSTDNKLKSSSKVTSPSSDIPHIKRKESENDSLNIAEVQTAMKASESFLQNKDWVNDDLLTKIEKNEVLFKKLSNPEFAKAISEFQTNPQGAMMKYADNIEMQKFLKEFCGVMGDHFSSLGEKEGQNTSPGQIPDIITKQLVSDNEIKEIKPSTQISSEDEKKLECILSSAEIKEVLMDEQIQNLFHVLKTNPKSGERILRESTGDMKKKIKILIDAGLLQVQQR